MKTVKFVIFIIYMQECNSTSKIKSNLMDNSRVKIKIERNMLNIEHSTMNVQRSNVHIL